jgi:hypothetical protein
MSGRAGRDIHEGRAEKMAVVGDGGIGNEPFFH